MGNQLIAGRLEDRYYLQKVKLGQGAFGVVWRGLNKETNEQVAVKQLHKGAMWKLGVCRETIELEIKVMMACSHVNILRLHEHFEDSQYVSLVLDYCDGGDFGDKVNERAATLQEPEIADWMKQILSAIGALHSKSICHRDIKPDNFMVKGAHPGQLVLADFGLAKFIKDGERFMDKSGTPAFMSPELSRLPSSGVGYGREVDLWAAGVIMCMLLCGGYHPFVKDNRLDVYSLERGIVNFSNGALSDLVNFVQQQQQFSAEAQTFCRRLLDTNAATRVTADAALIDPWLLKWGSPIIHSAADGARRFKNIVAEQEGRPRVMAQAHLDHEDHKEMLKVAERQREALKIMMPKQAPQTLCAKGQTAQGRLPANVKCRYFSSTKKAWIAAFVQSFNEDGGTYELDVKSCVRASNISPRADVEPSEAWPRGTFVSYTSATSGQSVPAVVISFNALGCGVGTYNLDVKDGAEVDRIRLRVS